MIESPDFHLQYERMNPPQRNQELRGLFDMLPDFDAIDILGELTTDKSVDAINERAEQRMNSPFTHNLRNRLKTLLTFGFTTDASKAFIARQYEVYLKRGIVKVEVVPDIPALELWANDLKWVSPENGGMFTKSEAQEVDRALYEHAVRNMLRHSNLVEKFSHEFGYDNPQIEDATRALYERKRKLSGFELSLLSNEDRVTAIIAEADEEETLEDIQLIGRWREEHIRRFYDEP